MDGVFFEIIKEEDRTPKPYPTNFLSVNAKKKLVEYGFDVQSSFFLFRPSPNI